MCGIINNSGAVWQEQRQFALCALRDFAFGKRDIDGIIQEEAQLLIQGRGKKVLAKFCEESSVWADGLCIGC